MATVKGKWTFNDVLIDTNNIYQDVNFSTDGKNWDGGNNWNSIFIGDTGAAPFRVVSFRWWSGEHSNEQVVYNLEEYDGGIIQIGWEDEAYKTIDFGETEQTVSDAFYAWLIENAVQAVSNIKINVTGNGTTTLATAGKYCDRNIDVNVNIPSYETELAEQKAITDSILDRSITSYYNDTVTVIGTYAFRSTSIERAEFTKNITIRNVAFADASNFAKLILRSESVCTLEKTGGLSNTAIAQGTGYIYVPDDLVDTYKTATNWATFADQIKSISELEE